MKRTPSLILPAGVAQDADHRRGQQHSLGLLKGFIRRMMGQAAAAVLLDKARSAVSDAEAEAALLNITALPEDNERRARAERAAWRAVADNQYLRGDLFPPGMCAALSAAFGALDSGVTTGLAAPIKNSRPASAHNRDSLSRVLALEVEFHKALLALEYDTEALSLVTGVINPETPDRTPDTNAVTLPLLPLTWKQVKDLLGAGRKLADPLVLGMIRETGYAIAAGLTSQEEALPSEQVQLRSLFADDAWRRAFLSATFSIPMDGRSKPRTKKRTARPARGRKPSATVED